VYSSEPHRGWLPWGALAPILAIVFVVAAAIPFELGFDRLGLIDAHGNPVGLRGISLFLLLPFAATGLLVLGWVRFVERRSLASIGLTRPGAGGIFVRGHLIGCATIVLVVLAIWIAGGFDAASYAPAWSRPRELLGIAALLPCFLVQASVEEIVFRGWMLSAVARKFNVAWAVALSSLIFCLLHFSPRQPWLVTLNLVLFGLFVCAWALRANNIWGVMGWHAGWNWLLATGFELPVTGLDLKMPALLVAMTPRGSDYLTGGAQGPEGSIACTVFLVVAIFILTRKRKTA
jgi:membrane protease YdiL (CAAX protease family)